MPNVIFGRELGSSEHGDVSFFSVQSGKALDSLADTCSVGCRVPTCHSTPLLQATDHVVLPIVEKYQAAPLSDSQANLEFGRPLRT